MRARAQVGAAQTVCIGRPSATTTLDAMARNSVRPFNLRWAYVHLLEETARHLGQMDILREVTDGATGE